MGTIWVVHWSHHSFPSAWSSPYHHPIPSLLTRLFLYLLSISYRSNYCNQRLKTFTLVFICHISLIPCNSMIGDNLDDPLAPPFPPLCPLFCWSPPPPTYDSLLSSRPFSHTNQLHYQCGSLSWPPSSPSIRSLSLQIPSPNKKRLNKAGRRDYQT